ncbi:hypothetical protein D3C80_1846240 [compost metagenome]
MHPTGLCLYGEGAIADQLVLVVHRHDVQLDPVFAAVLVAILDQPQPGFCSMKVLPQVVEQPCGHIWVAQHRNRLADQFIPVVAANPGEGLVTQVDGAFDIGAQNHWCRIRG